MRHFRGKMVRTNGIRLFAFFHRTEVGSYNMDRGDASWCSGFPFFNPTEVRSYKINRGDASEVIPQRTT
jgi:hypothetical protein